MGGAKNSGRVYEFGRFRLDAARLLLLREGEPVTVARADGSRQTLTPKVIQTLVALVERGGEIVSKDELMEAVWRDTYVDESNLSSNISLLRKVLGETDAGAPYIETFPKRGYRFNADVRAAGEQREGANVEASPREFVAATPRAGQLAVLPFRTLGACGEDDYLGLGLADALITQLSHTGQIVVRPTSAVARYADLQAGSTDAGRALGVDAVLEGSVQQAGGRLRLTVRMLAVADGAPVWGEKFDAAFTDIFSVQDEIAERVARALSVRLSGEGRERLTARHTDDPEAYQLYLKGRYFMSKNSPPALRSAIECFARAVARDAAYAQAYAGLAETYCFAGYLLMPPREAMPKAREAAVRALELNPSLAEAHTALGVTRGMYEWDFEGAARSFGRALEINPNYAEAHRHYGLYLALMRRFDEGVEELRRALELDPLSLIYNAYLASALYRARRLDEALAQCRRALELDPNLLPARGFLGLILLARGETQAAIEALRQQRRLSDASIVLSQLAHALAAAGETAEAREILAELLERERRGEASQEFVGIVYVALGDLDSAYEWFEKAYRERAVLLPMMFTEPRGDALRGDPRFDELRRRIGLPAPTG